MFRQTHPRGFTLIELLVVISIIALLIALLLPALDEARFVSRQLLCKTNLRQVAIGMNTYSVDEDNWYPARGWTYSNGAFAFSPWTEPDANNPRMLAPYLTTAGGDSSSSRALDARFNELMRCPEGELIDSATYPAYYYIFSNQLSGVLDFQGYGWVGGSFPADFGRYGPPQPESNLLRNPDEFMVVQDQNGTYTGWTHSILASDMTMRTGGYTATNHVRGTIELTSINRIYLNYRSNEGTAITNYAFTDGSVRDFSYNPAWPTNDHPDMMTSPTSGIPKDAVMFPKQWLRE